MAVHRLCLRKERKRNAIEARIFFQPENACHFDMRMIAASFHKNRQFYWSGTVPQSASGALVEQTHADRLNAYQGIRQIGYVPLV